MQVTKTANQMIDFQKTMFNNGFNTMVMLQDQAEKMSNTLMDQTPWVPEEGKKAVTQWVNAFKEGRQYFKKSIDEGFENAQKMFTESVKKEKTE
jgi:polyhydroxyalkanoate synthesis regulator phasin